MTLGRSGADGDIVHGEDRIAAYTARPASGSGPGVLVVHGAFGLVDSIRDACERLAREGFVALAPDLLGGRQTADPESAQHQLASLDRDQALGMLDAGVGALLGDVATRGARVGVLGFGAGGSLALVAAAFNRRVGAVVDVQGPLGEAERAAIGLSERGAPVLAIFGEHDASAAAGAARALEAALQDAGVRVSLRVVREAGEDFMDEGRPDCHHAAGAAEAWGHLLAFLRSAT